MGGIQYGAGGLIADKVSGGKSTKAIDKFLGFNQQGEYYQPGEYSNPALDVSNIAAKQYGDQGLNRSINAYGTDPGMSLQQALAQGHGAGADANYADMMAMSPIAAQKMATEQVQTNPILGQLFGKGGAMERYNTEEQDLAKRGYSLKPEDYEAYGQASGDIARMFGQQEQGLAQSMADRGFSAAPSGVAGSQFSGLQGNKGEMLARSQRDIAQNRMEMNRQRLNDTRQQLAGMGQQGQSAIFGTRDRNLQGTQAKQGMLANTGQIADSAYRSREAAKQASIASKQGAKTPGLGEYLGMGIGKLTYNAPSMGAKAAAGGV